MSIALTDDEIAAICVSRRLTWPAALPSVDGTAEALNAAEIRGTRSLLVRELASAQDDRLELSTELSGLIQLVADATSHVAAYAARADRLSQLAGSGAYAFVSGEEAVLDLVTPAGIHELRRASADEAQQIVIALLRNAFDFGLNGGNGEGRLVAVSDLTSSSVVVGQGSLRVGTMMADNGEFSTSESVEDWEEARILAAIGVA